MQRASVLPVRLQQLLHTLIGHPGGLQLPEVCCLRRRKIRAFTGTIQQLRKPERDRRFSVRLSLFRGVLRLNSGRYFVLRFRESIRATASLVLRRHKPCLRARQPVLRKAHSPGIFPGRPGPVERYLSGLDSSLSRPDSSSVRVPFDLLKLRFRFRDRRASVCDFLCRFRDSLGRARGQLRDLIEHRESFTPRIPERGRLVRFFGQRIALGREVFRANRTLSAFRAERAVTLKNAAALQTLIMGEPAGFLNSGKASEVGLVFDHLVTVFESRIQTFGRLPEFQGFAVARLPVREPVKHRMRKLLRVNVRPERRAVFRAEPVVLVHAGLTVTGPQLPGHVIVFDCIADRASHVNSAVHDSELRCHSASAAAVQDTPRFTQSTERGRRFTKGGRTLLRC